MRRALLVGIDHYERAPPLLDCVADVRSLEALLARHHDNSPNFACDTLIGESGAVVTRASILRRWSEHLHDFTGDALFYFSGHGAANDLGSHLFTWDGSPDDPGLPREHVVRLANRSRAASVTIVLDCCYAGAAGNDEEVVGNLENTATLREGVTILAGSRPRQRAVELGGHGVFTRLVVAALAGGAADVRGRVSAAAVYAYVEEALGALDQRPLYKSHAATLEPLRLCEPAVYDGLLRRLPRLFARPDAELRLAPSYERTHPDARPEHVSDYQDLKRLQIARLLRCDKGVDMYDTALASGVGRCS